MFSSYSDFNFLHDPDIDYHAKMENRFTNHGLFAYVTDVMLLKDTDFFVGTFTSNVSTISRVLCKKLVYFLFFVSLLYVH